MSLNVNSALRHYVYPVWNHFQSIQENPLGALVTHFTSLKLSHLGKLEGTLWRWSASLLTGVLDCYYLKEYTPLKSVVFKVYNVFARACGVGIEPAPQEESTPSVASSPRDVESEEDELAPKLNLTVENEESFFPNLTSLIDPKPIENHVLSPFSFALMMFMISRGIEDQTIRDEIVRKYSSLIGFPFETGSFCEEFSQIVERTTLSEKSMRAIKPLCKRCDEWGNEIEAYEGCIKIKNFIIYPQKWPLTKEFKEEMQKIGVELFDHQGGDKGSVCNGLNKMIENGTDGAVKQMFNSQDFQLNDLFVANTVVLDLPWEKGSFPTHAYGAFTSFKGASSRVVIVKEESLLCYYESSTYIMVEKKVASGCEKRVSLLFFLPKEKGEKSLAQLEKNVKIHSFIKEAVNHAQEKKVKFKFPVVNGLEAKYTMKGKSSLLFSRMRGQKDELVHVKQNSQVGWDKNGLTAISASVAVMGSRGRDPIPECEVILDRPFTWVIYIHGAIAFTGSIADSTYLRSP